LEQEKKIFIASLKPSGAFMSYIIGTFVRAASDQDQDPFVSLSNIIRVSEVPSQTDRGMTVQLAVMTDVYFSVDAVTDVRLADLFMTRIANPETDRKIIDQYNAEILKLSTQRAGLVAPRSIKGIV
jgi:hypothetical protein